MQLLIDLTELPIVAAVIIGWYRHKVLPREFRILLGFITISAVVQLSSMFLSYQGSNNMWLLHVYVPVGTIVLLWFYHELLLGLIPIWLLPTIAFLIVPFALVNTLWLEPIDTFCIHTLAVQGVLVITLAIALFVLLLDDRAKKRIHIHLPSLNWINSGLLLYFSVSQILFFLGNWMTTLTSSSFQKGWVLHSILIACMYTCFSIGLWKYPKNPIS